MNRRDRELYLPDLHSLSLLVLERTGLYDARAAYDRAAKMEKRWRSEREGGGGGGGEREGGGKTGGVRVNARYAAFVGDGRKGVASRDREARANDMALDKLRRLGDVRDARYFHLGEDFMRR